MNRFARLIDKIKFKLTREHRCFPRCEINETDEIMAFFSLEGTSAYFHEHATFEQPHPVINLSSRGIALFLLEGEEPEFFRANRYLTLKLVIEGNLLTLPAEVVYVLEDIKRIGLRFSHISEQHLDIISRFIDTRFLASSLKEVPIKSQLVKGVICRWFHGKNNTDLFSWATQGGHIYRHLFVFVDNVVEWTESGELSTGKVKRGDFALTYTAVFSKEPPKIDIDKTRNVETIKMAGNIIKLADIDSAVKEHFLKLPV